MDSTSTPLFLLLDSVPSTAGDAPNVASGVSYGHSGRQKKRSGRMRQRAINAAVFAHVRAIRSLGRTKISNVEISDALSLPIAEVDLAIRALKTKGMKVL